MGTTIRPSITLTILIALVAFYLGVTFESHQPVCTSPTEDSAITDCDWHDGRWWQEP